ncbi:hypothetical protein [Pantoea agglomerans]|uniref:hypothetical protein n=1 Tax=Enterobacter agglomerans TaxID=549 RepID=UPI003C7D5A61
MNYKNPLETATITTNMLAHYLYSGINELSRKEAAEYSSVDDVYGYLECSTDSITSSDFLSNVLVCFFGLNHNHGHYYFDSEKELKSYVDENNLILINDCLAVSDESDHYSACQQALKMLEEEREYEKQFDYDDE